MKILILLTSLNSASTILTTINNIKAQIPEADILVVDRKSTDQTLKLLAKNNIEYLKTLLPTNYYDALSLGLMYAWNYKYDFVVEFNDQNSYATKDILYLLQVIEYQNVDFVFGSRLATYDKNFKKEKFLRLISRWKTKKKLIDPGMRLKVYGSKAIAFFGSRMVLNKPTPDQIVNLLNKNYSSCNTFIKPIKINNKNRQISYKQKFVWIFAMLFINPFRFKKANPIEEIK